MAQTLIVRPYVFAASSRAARSLFLRQAQPTKPFVSAVLFTRARTKLRSHSKDGIGRSFGFGFPPVGGRCFSSPAAHMNDAGSVESPLMQSMEKKIKEHLNAELVTVKDASGDGRHVSIDVVSSAFEGQSAVNRQRMVYKAIWEELQSTVHAVDQMTTRTPNEAASKK
ncbi:protein BOLA4, chloroplastic/mitochondrial-like [Juglans microcarpa x Juglans regia]|uniref:protein BOLA4, chloroplastic/mitochondrial-like n=1 Tax=Juglans microcarpa x Juglans regia TaxID=2249226 RepID=UPI001B7E8F60|nr:protein BOLA4, chloroplastic/mitochondrial-like [Juglans microcarpa x Juglans regia]